MASLWRLFSLWLFSFVVESFSSILKTTRLAAHCSGCEACGSLTTSRLVEVGLLEYGRRWLGFAMKDGSYGLNEIWIVWEARDVLPETEAFGWLGKPFSFEIVLVQIAGCKVMVISREGLHQFSSYMD